jgi:RNase H-like domain found in reverse transcriptase/Integrase zinc binding domain
MEEKSYFLKPKKCQFEKDSMEILGWLVGGGKIQIDPTKVKGISEWPRELKNKEEVRRTLGVLGYQRPFIWGFSNITRPLHDLTKKDAPFIWTPACTEALDTLIKCVTAEPVLWHPDPSHAYKLEVDASSFALGSILFQRDNNGKCHAVAYHSQALTPSEWNYAVGDREFLAMIEGLKCNWHLVMGSLHKLMLYTDHNNLHFYRHPQKLNGQVARYIAFLVDFNLEIKHLPGHHNQADPLSRHPDYDDGSQDNEEVTALPDSLFIKLIESMALDKQIRDRQHLDKELLEKWDKLHQLAKDSQGVRWKGRALVTTGGDDVKRTILHTYHDSITAGYPGIWKMYASLLRSYWWPTLRTDVEEYIRGCIKCQANKTIMRWNVPPLDPIIPEGEPTPFAHITVDFITKLPLLDGHDTIMMITNQGCTKAVILLPCSEESGSEDVTKLFLEWAFPFIRLPQCIISDRNTHFTSRMFQEVCWQLEVKQNLSMAYHPQTDGQLECTNQTLEATLCHGSKGPWLKVSINDTCSAQVLSTFTRQKRGFTRREE